jgi:hypothetical protein
MSVLDLLRKLGILRYGAKAGTYRSAADQPDELFMDDVYDSKKDLVHKEDFSAVAARGDHTGRKVFFWIALVLGWLMVALTFAMSGLSAWSTLALLLWAAFLVYARRFAFADRGSAGLVTAAFVGTVAAATALIFLGAPGATFTAHVDVAPPQPDDAAVAPPRPGGLAFERTVLARSTKSGSLEAVDDGVFNQGDVVHMVLVNVRGFQAGEDGRHWYDMDVVITGPDGNVVLSGQDVLGETGHVALPDGVASTPYANMRSAGAPPGKYTFTITIRDKIGGGSATATREFVIR